MSRSRAASARLRRIASRATPLWDRRSYSDRRRHSKGAAHQRLHRWRVVLGTARILNSRLRGSGFSSTELERILAGHHRFVGLPSWTTTLGEILSSDSGFSPGMNAGGPQDRSFSRRAPLPFEHVLVPFVRYARNAISDKSDLARILCAPALIALERQLLAHLSFVASPTIGRDFYMYRFSRVPLAAFENCWNRGPSSARIYREYVRQMREGRFSDLLDSHPVLARLLSQTVEQWVDAVAEFCGRFVRDFPAMRTMFGWRVDTPVKAIAQVRPSLSDRHSGGRTVLACCLKGGESVVYKPREVGPEIAFYSFVDWLNGHDLPLQLKSVRALDRSTHGWMEAVEFSPCHRPEQVRSFYRRAGMLIAALHVVAATDIHRDNLIASGEHPVVVDLETILNDAVRSPRGLPGGPSVMTTGMLPFWHTSTEKDECDMSALGADSAHDDRTRWFSWQAVNTDQMTMTQTAPATTSMSHRVRINGDSPSALEYLPDILEGFRDVYACVVHHREALLVDEALLKAFDGLNLRILLRSTVTYTGLQLHSLHPEFLADGIDRSIELEWLARPISPRVDQEGPRRVYECERASMEQLDVPRFTTAEWRGMTSAFKDRELRALFRERDSRTLRRRLMSLSEADCQQQLATIERAVRSRFAS